MCVCVCVCVCVFVFVFVFMCVHSLDPPLFSRGREVKFDYIPWRRGIWKFKKGGGGAWAGLLKRGEVLTLFLFNFLKVDHFYS